MKLDEPFFIEKETNDQIDHLTVTDIKHNHLAPITPDRLKRIHISITLFLNDLILRRYNKK